MNETRITWGSPPHLLHFHQQRERCTSTLILYSWVYPNEYKAVCTSKSLNVQNIYKKKYHYITQKTIDLLASSHGRKFNTPPCKLDNKMTVHIFFHFAFWKREVCPAWKIPSALLDKGVSKKAKWNTHSLAFAFISIPPVHESSCICVCVYSQPAVYD